ncbi:hypothetical protein pipiens_005628 [Culex pipiens pipiens]|uniref:Uncharacterized protein n=1 Tax=Culex pipiens pipiens TaxID=38569 RepID=A0ABD1DVR6_CULPP
MSRMAPFVERFVTVQRKIIEAGIWHRWTELARKIYRVNRALTTTVFGFDDLLPMWQILLYGCLLSLVVFIAQFVEEEKNLVRSVSLFRWDLCVPFRPWIRAEFATSEDPFWGQGQRWQKGVPQAEWVPALKDNEQAEVLYNLFQRPVIKCESWSTAKRPLC